MGWVGRRGVPGGINFPFAHERGRVEAHGNECLRGRVARETSPPSSPADQNHFPFPLLPLFSFVHFPSFLLPSFLLPLADLLSSFLCDAFLSFFRSNFLLHVFSFLLISFPHIPSSLSLSFTTFPLFFIFHFLSL